MPVPPALDRIAERIGFEETRQGGYRRGGPIRIVKARAVYKTKAPESEEPAIVTTTIDGARRVRVPREAPP